MSERDFLTQLAKRYSYPQEILKGIGDDAAVIQRGDAYELISTDMFTEGDHFRCDWFSPQQIGMKAIEASVSDIYAMGGDPQYILLSISLPKDRQGDFLHQLFEGIHQTIEAHRCTLIGGDTTHGNHVVIDVVVIGRTKHPVYRSGAQVGDLICVTGELGSSWAGLELFRQEGMDAPNLKEYDYVVQKYLEPKSQPQVSRQIREYATAMIDVSDGLASETRHICEQSQVGAVVDAAKIPISTIAHAAAKHVGKSALDFALSGGEDFQLLYTVSPENILNDAIIVGEIVDLSEGVILKRDGKMEEMPKGYDHFENSV